MLSEPGEHQVGQQEPHGEATRDSDQSGCGQGSQLRASRTMLASRRDLPKLPLAVDTEASTPALDAGVETTTSVAEASMRSPADVRRGPRLYKNQLPRRRAVLAEAKDRPSTPRAAETTNVWNQGAGESADASAHREKTSLSSQRSAKKCVSSTTSTVTSSVPAVSPLQPPVEKALPVQSLSRYRQDLLWSVKRADPR